MRLGGVDIEIDMHCAGHSDGDAVCHAVTDAILGAAGLGDIGEMFPDTDPANKNKDSIIMLAAARERVQSAGFTVYNIDVTVVAERPKIGPYRVAMCARLADVLCIPATRVSVKGKTNEGMGWIGHAEGLAVIAIATVAVAG